MIGFPIHPDVLERLKRQSERKLIVRHVRDPFAKVATDADLGRPDRRLALTKGVSMALTYCESCQQLEGDTRELDGEVVCAECNEPVTGVPEHDDYDLER